MKSQNIRTMALQAFPIPVSSAYLLKTIVNFINSLAIKVFMVLYGKENVCTIYNWILT